jgi:3-isopropylmalate/(R)-2-methylmalate dehydratase small subunit
MEKFIKHRARVAALDRANVDTDQIIPKQFLKLIKRTGFGPALFFDWRYTPDGKDNPEFELNAAHLKDAADPAVSMRFGRSRNMDSKR